ncbi:MAG TPA: flagellar hook-length control protein FliK [Rhodocyclaceae bacterium]|nr:flagellar hook-length control protein FliK [Rhodocyclaceae bacterium]
MVLIPSDAGINLRQPGDNALQPVARVPGIPADLPELRQGQSFTATIQEVLPDNTYRALVAGKSITLSLPESAKAGDTLELVVLDRTPKTILARLSQPAEPGAGAAPEPYQGASLSRAAQTLGTLLAADLPDLRLGQQFSAKIQEVLPDKSYKALVSGKSVALSLPESVQAGDTLELVVIDRTPTTAIVRLAEQPGAAAAAAAEPYPYATLSRAGQMIGALVTPEGEPPPAAALNRGQPLLAQPPQNGAELAPVLSKAVAQSGLFYEAHQAQWVAGKLPLAALLEEPQGQHSAPATIAARAAPAGDAVPKGDAAPAGSAAPSGRPGEVQAAAGHAQEAQKAGAAPAAAGAEPTRSKTAPPAPAPAMPEAVRPLVQQQLDAAATQRLLWHGEVWPGQTMQWQVEREQSGSGSSAEAEERWQTTLRLSTPRLGEVQAAIQLSGGGVRIALATPTGSSAADLRAATPALEQALASAGVPLLGMTVKHETE